MGIKYLIFSTGAIKIPRWAH